MFKRELDKYISDEGFTLEVLGRTGLRYIDGEKTLFIDSEILSGFSEFNMVIWVSEINKWDSGELISSEEKKRIIHNIYRIFDWEGSKIDMV